MIKNILKSKIPFLFILMFLVTGCSSNNDISNINDNGGKDVVILSGSQSESKTINSLTIEGLSMHKYSGDCWIAYGIEVYDITSYIQKNPDTNIIGYCGTVGFESVLDSKNIDFSDIQELSLYKGDLE